MSKKLYKKKNGKYALWTTVCDDFLIDDATEKELHDYILKEMIEDFEEDFKKKIEEIENIIFSLGPKTYEEACELRDRTKRLNKRIE